MQVYSKTSQSLNQKSINLTTTMTTKAMAKANAIAFLNITLKRIIAYQINAKKKERKLFKDVIFSQCEVVFAFPED